MKNATILSYVAIALLATCFTSLSTAAQDSPSVKDSSIVIPFKDLPVTNIKATGDKKTGQLVISMDFENKWKSMVDVSLSVSGWSDLGITSDKGIFYKVHTYYNKLTDDDPNKGYKPVGEIQFGTKKMKLATILPQNLNTGEKRTFTVKVNGYDKTSKLIKEFHIRCIYKQYGAGGGYGDEQYKINQIPIEWK